MVLIDSDDYHDFVIKDGKLVGEFDQMYQKSKDIPWHQDQPEKFLDIKLFIELLKEYSLFDYICDFGSGLGYFLDVLRNNVGAPRCRLIGYDVSPICCKKGKEKFPDIKFKILDLMKYSESVSNTVKVKKKEEKRLFVIRGTLWYVFPEMENVVRNIGNKTEKGDFLLISQNFPPLESEFAGKDVIPNPTAVLDWFDKYFSSVKTIFMEDCLSIGNDNWFIALLKRK